MKDWFSANETIPITSHPLSNTDSQVICLDKICLVDGSWNPTSRLSGCGLVWKDISGQIQLLGTWRIRRRGVSFAFRIGSSEMGDGEYMLRHSTCQNFALDCLDLVTMIKEIHA